FPFLSRSSLRWLVGQSVLATLPRVRCLCGCAPLCEMAEKPRISAEAQSAAQPAFACLTQERLQLSHLLQGRTPPPVRMFRLISSAWAAQDWGRRRPYVAPALRCQAVTVCCCVSQSGVHPESEQVFQ